MNQTSLILQARVGSTRLPNKTVRLFHSQQSLLELVLGNLKRTFPARNIIVATSDDPENSKITEIAAKLNVRCFVGDEHDVLKRFIDAATEYGVEKIVRICADNPFLMNGYILNLIDQADQGVDYVSYRYRDGTPTIRSHSGLFAELVSRDAITKISEITSDKFYHEHLTSFILDNPTQFKCRFLDVPDCIETVKDLRLTVDTEEDFTNAQRIYARALSKYGSAFSVTNLIEVINSTPDALKIMAKQIIENEK